MPKPTKLHSKGKPSSIQKSVKIDDKEVCESSDPDETIRKFQLELCWCIQQLEKALCDNKNGHEPKMQDTWKVLTTLKNNNQSMIRKRQLMRTFFGDYRAKMAAEEKKLTKMASKMKITESKVPPKATFLRKSAFLTTGDETFRFNFGLNPEQLNTTNDTPESKILELTDNSNTVECTDKSNLLESTDNSNTQEIGNTPKEEATEEDSKAFKFTFSGSGFKFNFNNS